MSYNTTTNTITNILGFRTSEKRSKSLEIDLIISAFSFVSARMMIIDNDLNIIAANDSVKSFLTTVEQDIKKDLPNFSVASLIGTNIDSFHKKPEHQRKMIAAMKEPFETTITLAGHIFALRATPLLSVKGGRLGTVMEWFDSKVMDYTGQVEGLNRSQAIIHFELDGTITDANENFLNATGYNLDEIKGKHHSMFTEPEFAASQEYKDFWKTLNEGNSQSGQYKRLGKGGKEVWIEASYNPICDMNGKPFKVAKFAVDVTQRKRESQRMGNDVNSLVGILASSATEMQATSQTLAAAAEQTRTQSNMVAAATEELATSVNEISFQVSNSVKIVDEAVDEARRSEELVASLVEAASRIGEVTQLISDIADQTNLLALNATIEAARAGDAGKGFAVVASEVKSLAAETAKATENISSQISNMQTVTRTTADAIKKITTVVSKVNEISTAISGAVEEQSAATQEVSSNIISVQTAANETGESSASMLEVSKDLSMRSEELQTLFDDFLAKN